jgi:hypothetical protein
VVVSARWTTTPIGRGESAGRAEGAGHRPALRLAVEVHDRRPRRRPERA